MGDLVERQALHDAGQPQAVVAVEVRDADPPEGGGRHARQQHLALRPLAGVEQDPVAVPPQEVSVVVAVPGGRLTGRTEDHELADGPILL